MAFSTGAMGLADAVQPSFGQAKGKGKGMRVRREWTSLTMMTEDMHGHTLRNSQALQTIDKLVLILECVQILHHLVPLIPPQLQVYEKQP